MTTKIMEAKAIISATDATGNTFASVGKKLDKVMEAAKRVDKALAGAGSRRALDSWSRAFDGLAAAGRNIDSLGSRFGTLERKISGASRAMAAFNRAAAAAQRAAASPAGQIAGGALSGHLAKNVAKKSIIGAAEFDIATRKQRAFMDLGPADQKALLAQAKRIGQETQFSNTDVVKAQTASMQGLPAGFSPKLKAEVAEGILENVRNYALVMEADLQESAEAIRSYLQNTGKNISTKDKALKEANRATNQLVRMAKLGGMNAEDVSQAIKFAASPGTAAGISSETLMSLFALARRGGLRGDEAGVFVRSTASKLVSPTNKGRMALQAAGIDFDSYVRKPTSIDPGRLEGAFRETLGKDFTPAIKDRLSKAFADPKVAGSQGAFTKAVVEATSELFPKTKRGKISAQDARNIAKTAGSFYKVSATGVDTERLLEDAMGRQMTLAQLNAWLTDKHGGKGAITQRQWDDFRASREQIGKAGDDPNYAKRMADEIMGGLGGSFERLKGSVENFYLALGTATEKFTGPGMERLGNFLDSVSNLPEPVLQLGTAVAAASAAVLSFSAALKTFQVINGLGGAAAGAAGAAGAGAAAAAGRANPATFAAGGLAGFGQGASTAAAMKAVQEGAAAASGIGLARSVMTGALAGVLAEAVGQSILSLAARTSPDAGKDAGTRLRDRRGTMSDVYRRAFDDDRERQGIPALGAGGKQAIDVTGKVDAELKGSADVQGEAKVSVTVTASSTLIQIVDSLKALSVQLRGQLNANGPGSTGRSSPDAAAPATGAGGP